jgi:hypothetical protein
MKWWRQEQNWIKAISSSLNRRFFMRVGLPLDIERIW